MDEAALLVPQVDSSADESTHSKIQAFVVLLFDKNKKYSTSTCCYSHLHLRSQL